MPELQLPAGRVAIVGLAKNCGKTTTLNAVSGALYEREQTVGLLSIGIDGETSDVLLGTPKPPVVVRPDQLVVTADQALATSSARWEWVASLGFRTPLGEAVLARCLEGGELVLGGLRHRDDVARAADLLADSGAETVLIDGAYGRMTAASPELSDATIVSTGAILADEAGALARRTLAVLRRLALPRVAHAPMRHLAEAAREAGRAMLRAGDPLAFESESALLGLRRERDLWGDDIDTIAIPGLVSDGVVDELLALGRAGHLVVTNGTSIHCSDRQFRRLDARWTVEVLDPIRVVGVAVNPTSITGARVDAADVARRLVSEHPHLTVFDPALGLHSLDDSSVTSGP
jgi:hypothetical protein